MFVTCLTHVINMLETMHVCLQYNVCVSWKVTHKSVRRANVYIHTYINAHTCPARTNKHTHTHTHTHTYTHTRTHACTHTRTRTHTHARSHTHIFYAYIHTCVWMCRHAQSHKHHAHMLYQYTYIVCIK